MTDDAGHQADQVKRVPAVQRERDDRFLRDERAQRGLGRLNHRCIARDGDRFLEIAGLQLERKVEIGADRQDVLLRLTPRKPESSAFTVYGPTGRLGKTNRPASVVTVCC